MLLSRGSVRIQSNTREFGWGNFMLALQMTWKLCHVLPIIILVLKRDKLFMSFWWTMIRLLMNRSRCSIRDLEASANGAWAVPRFMSDESGGTLKQPPMKSKKVRSFSICPFTVRNTFSYCTFSSCFHRVFGCIMFTKRFLTYKCSKRKETRVMWMEPQAKAWGAAQGVAPGGIWRGSQGGPCWLEF